MADLYSKKYAVPPPMRVDGTAMIVVDDYDFTANTADGDVLNFHLPAGIRVTDLEFQCDDIDTDGTPEVVFSVGYAKYDSSSSLAADATYFAAAGQTTLGTGGRLRCAFDPIKFEEDVKITVTIATNAETFAAGGIFMIATGIAEGPK